MKNHIFPLNNINTLGPTQGLILLLFLQTCPSSGFLSASIMDIFSGPKGSEMLGLLLF